MYLIKPKLYNTGFLLNDNIMRYKQDLPNQVISNITITALNDRKILANPYFNNIFFPIRGLNVNYNLSKIPDSCGCLQNIQSLEVNNI